MARLIILMVLMFLFQTTPVQAQSPYLHVKASMNNLSNKNYKIEMKICKLRKGSAYTSIFGRDTSKVDFKKTDSSHFHCTEFFETRNPDQPYNYFEYGNQNYAYESMLVILISDQSSRSWQKQMVIRMPVIYQSFITSIEIKDIVYSPGKTIFIENYPDNRVDGRLSVVVQGLK